MLRTFPFTNDLCKLKINDPSSIPFLSNQNIIGPDISMDNAECMDSVESL
jgi:hypothetical protein